MSKLEIIENLFRSKNYQNITESDLNEITINTAFYSHIQYIGTPLYRSIKYKNKPSTIHNLIYPPKHLCKIGRANRNEEQIFYCANEKTTSLFEIGAQKGDLCVISKWISESTLVLNTIGLTPDVYKEVSKGHEIILPEYLEDGTSAEFISNKENLNKLELIGRMFSKENFENDLGYYELTNRIRYAITNGEMANFGGRTMDGLKYPSIRNDGKADCIALFPVVVEHKLINIDQVEFIEILEAGECFKYKVLDAATSITNEQIDWLDLRFNYSHQSEQDDLVFLTKGNDIFCYNYEGEEMEPD